MARVTVEDCVLKIPNRFELVLVSSQRAREINAGAALLVDRDNDKNPVVSLREIADTEISLDGLRESHDLAVERKGVFDSAIEGIKVAKAAGFMVCTNTTVFTETNMAELDAIVAGLGIRSFFHSVLTSGIVGYEKPHPGMFEAALQQSVRHSPIWMVGDNVELDCIASEAFGAKAILVRTAGGFERRAEDLWAVLELIES